MRAVRCDAESSSVLPAVTQSLTGVAVLPQLCTRWDEARYSRLQAAYQLLGKTQTAADQLLMHMTSAVHTASAQVVLAHAPSGCDAQRRQYANLCAVSSLVEAAVVIA